MYDFFRPFEILKLIRDGDITNVADLMCLTDSASGYRMHQFIQDIEQVGLIKINKNRGIKATPLLADVPKALRISLKKLTPYNEHAIVCSPAFGPPSQPPLNVDVFVLMPFAEELKPVYDDHIKTVVAELGLEAARADDFFTADSIISDIWNAISAARFLVADCTGRNPNVFYELGVAHTLGKRVILIAQSHDDIPFDVQHIRAILYEYTPRGMRGFEKSLKETLRRRLQFPPCNLLDLIAQFRNGR